MRSRGAMMIAAIARAPGRFEFAVRPLFLQGWVAFLLKREAGGERPRSQPGKGAEETYVRSG